MRRQGPTHGTAALALRLGQPGRGERGAAAGAGPAAVGRLRSPAGRARQGAGFTALAVDEMIVVPIRSGVGARLGVNLGYLKFTPASTWNPF
jgi:hypothetical protein